MRKISALEVGHYQTEINQRIHDMPVGDAFSGPAYGEYEKSKALGMIIGVVASVATMGAALPMLAGTIGMQIAGGVMMAGGVLTGVGAITGNKKLMKIGGVLSLAGGLGGMAVSSGMLGNTAGVGVNATGSEALASFAQNASGSIDSVLGTNLASKAGDYYSAAGYSAETSAGAIEMAGTQASGVETTAMNEPSPVVGQAIDATGAPVAGETASAGAGILSQASATPAAGADTAAAGAAAAPTKGIIGKFGDFLKTPEGMKVGMSALEKGMAAGFGPDEQASLDAMAAKYGAETAYLNTKNDEAAFQLANKGKQVAMISANDPDREAKVAAAAKAGHPVAFIPAIGLAGAPSPQTAAQNTQAANPGAVRAPTFAPVA